MWRLPTNFPLSYNLLPCLSLTRSGRAWMEERFCPSHCLICLGKALTSNTNLNDSSGNLGLVSEARLGLAQWPSLREHGKFAGSICHSQRELRKRTRKEWLNGLDPWSALVDVRRSAAAVVRWDYRKLDQPETLIADASKCLGGGHEPESEYFWFHMRLIIVLWTLQPHSICFDNHQF